MIDVCLDARLIHAGGIGTFLKNVLNALQQEVDFTVLCWKKDCAFLERFNLKKVVVVKSPIFSVQEQLELPLKIPPCSIFWSPHINIPFLPIRAKKRLTTIHDTFHLTMKEKFFFAWIFYNAAILLSDMITTVSEFSKSEILERCFVRAKNLKVIPHYVSDHFKPTLDETVKKSIICRGIMFCV